MQTGGIVFAVVAGAVAGAVALVRGPDRLLYLDTRSPRPTEVPQKPGPLARSVMRRLIFVALLTIGLGGMITAPLDAAVLLVALAGAGPLARLVAKRNPFGTVIDRLPSIARVAVAIPLVYGVSFLLIDAGLLKSVSEFFPVIAVFAVGPFVIELIAAEGAGSSVVRPLRAGVAGPAALSVTLLAVAAVAPLPVLADNGGSLVDMWPTIDIAVFAGMATPFIFWVAKRYPPPPPPPYDEEQARRDHPYSFISERGVKQLRKDAERILGKQPPPPPLAPEGGPAEQKARDRMKDVLKWARDKLAQRKKDLGDGPPASVGSVTGRKG